MLVSVFHTSSAGRLNILRTFSKNKLAYSFWGLTGLKGDLNTRVKGPQAGLEPAETEPMGRELSQSVSIVILLAVFS